ncbi:MAG: biopolymer transporter ExbD [Gammaproteobacteria bacterium]|nr:MAG: biopolymer transporter ExbD [Gammaproteobacteria bacterium]
MNAYRRRHRRRDTADLDITAFMNLMVILVPFLLITAVFSRLAILELNLPSSGDELADAPPEMQLEVIVRADRLEIGERNGGLLTRLPKRDGEYDYAGLTEYLKRVKASFPDKLDATILLEPEVPYDVLVQVMDAVRLFEEQPLDGAGQPAGEPVRAELFPEISIGDAPVLKRS